MKISNIYIYGVMCNMSVKLCTPCRIVRENFFEKWKYFVTNDNVVIRTDYIVIFFKGYINQVYLLTSCAKDISDDNYTLGILSLVNKIIEHEDNIMFNIKIVELPEFASSLSEYFVENKINDIIKNEKLEASRE